MDKLKQLWDKFKNHPEGNWILGWDDAQRLYKLIEKAKPKSVLDLGGGIGCSASIVAQVLNDFSIDGHVTSIEQYQKCYDLAKVLIPEELRRYITNKLIPAISTEIAEVPYHWFSVFETLPLQHYDLTVIDGPGPWFELNTGSNPHTEIQVKLPNGDFIALLPYLEEGALIYLDQRITTREVMGKYFAPYFNAIMGNKDFILLERTAKKYTGEVIDEDVKVMREIAKYNPDK